MTHFHHLSAIAAGALVSAIWQGTLLAAVVSFALCRLPGISAAARSAIWTAVFAIILSLHFTPFATDPNRHIDHSVHLASGWSLAVALVWLACSFFRAAEFALGAFRLARIANRATPVDTPRVSAGQRSYTLCTSPDVDRPSVLGFWSPRILLPAGLLEALTPGELHQVLLHETEHLRRSDDWTNLLQKLALVIFPLNPVLFWVERRLCLERELACDDRVLLACPARKAYATTLTHIAEHGIFRRGMALALGAFSGQSELGVRVHRILDRPARTMGRPATGFLTATLLLGVAVGSLTLAHAPRLISFTPNASSNPVASASAPTLEPGHDAPQPTEVKAIVPVLRQPRLLKASQRQASQNQTGQSRRHRATPTQPRWVDTTLREMPTPQRDAEPRLSLTVQRQQVFPVYVPTLVRYAALRTPDGWIIIQL